MDIRKKPKDEIFDVTHEKQKKNPHQYLYYAKYLKKDIDRALLRYL